MALLLDPEARSLVGPNQGALREPYLKLIHLMRSMEYDEGTSADRGLINGKEKATCKEMICFAPFQLGRIA